MLCRVEFSGSWSLVRESMFDYRFEIGPRHSRRMLHGYSSHWVLWFSAVVAKLVLTRHIE